MKQVSLKPVDRHDYSFLYRMLKERDPVANISHGKMPTWEQHLHFCITNPQQRWWRIVMSGNKKIGQCYVTGRDEIGIELLKEYQNQGLGKMVLTLIKIYHIGCRLFANISPKNKISQKFFKQNGFKLIQQTYSWN